MNSNSRVGGLPVGNAGDPLKLSHDINVPSIKIKPEAERNPSHTETNAIAVKNFSSRVHEPDQASKSIFERAWVSFKSFFTTTGASIYNFFAGLFGGSLVKDERGLHNYVKVSDKIGDVVGDPNQLENDDGLLYNMDVVEETVMDNVLDDVESIADRLLGIKVDTNNPGNALGVLKGLKNELAASKELMKSIEESLESIGEKKPTASSELLSAVEVLLKHKESEIEKAFVNILSKLSGDVYSKKTGLSSRLQKEVNLSPNSNLPSGIPNEGRNACFRISSIQALLAFDPIKKMIKDKLSKGFGETSNEFKARGWIKNALENLIDKIENRESPEDIKNAEMYLSEIIFGYGSDESYNLHVDFVKGDNNKQFDAITFLELILGTVLNYSHDEKPTNSIEVNGVVKSQDLAVDRKKSSVCVPLLTKINDLQGLVDACYLPKKVVGEWTFQNRDYNEYTQTVKVITKPNDVLVVQLDRRGFDGRTNQVTVNNRAVNMPSNGVLDFSIAHGMKGGTLEYGVKSFIRLHANSGSEGHYTTYANVNGKWCHFDDGRVTEVTDEKAQLEMARAYILMFERLK